MSLNHPRERPSAAAVKETIFEHVTVLHRAGSLPPVLVVTKQLKWAFVFVFVFAFRSIILAFWFLHFPHFACCSITGTALIRATRFAEQGFQVNFWSLEPLSQPELLLLGMFIWNMLVMMMITNQPFYLRGPIKLILRREWFTGTNPAWFRGGDVAGLKRWGGICWMQPKSTVFQWWLWSWEAKGGISVLKKLFHHF